VPVNCPSNENHHIFGCRRAAFLQKLLLRPSAKSSEPLRAAGVLKGRFEDL
jgi:hypothetical protein